MLFVWASPAAAHYGDPAPAFSSLGGVALSCGTPETSTTFIGLVPSFPVLLETAETSLKIGWGMAPNAGNKGYHVFRRPANSEWTLAWLCSTTPHKTIDSPGEKVFNDTGLTSGAGYTYFVCAVYETRNDANYRHCPGPGQLQTFWTTAEDYDPSDTLQPAQAPSGLTATGISDSTIRLTWTDNAGSSADGIEIRAGKAVLFNVAVSISSLTTLPPGTEIYHHTGLDPSTGWVYQVCAHKANKECTVYTAGQTADPPPVHQPPGPPLSSGCLQAEPESSSTIRVTWCGHLVYPLGLPHEYQVERSYGPATYWEPISVPYEDGDMLSLLDTPVNPNFTHHYRVCAENDIGRSCNPFPTGFVSATSWPLQAQPPANVEAIVHYQPQHDHSIELRWSNPNDPSHGEVEFVVSRWVHQVSGWMAIHSTEPKEVATPGETHSFIHGGLEGATEYRYRVCAYNEPYKSQNLTDCAQPVAATTEDSGIDAAKLLLAEHLNAIRSIQLIQRMPGGEPVRGEDCLSCSREYDLSSIRSSFERAGMGEPVTIVLYDASGDVVAELGSYRSYREVPNTMIVSPRRGEFSDAASGCGYRLEITGSGREPLGEAAICLER